MPSVRVVIDSWMDMTAATRHLPCADRSPRLRLGAILARELVDLHREVDVPFRDAARIVRRQAERDVAIARDLDVGMVVAAFRFLGHGVHERDGVAPVAATERSD